MNRAKFRLILKIFMWKEVYLSMEQKTIVIFTANVARRLLKDGFTIVDIKPDKKAVDSHKTLFVFKNENNIMDKIREYKEK